MSTTEICSDCSLINLRLAGAIRIYHWRKERGWPRKWWMHVIRGIKWQRFEHIREAHFGQQKAYSDVYIREHGMERIYKERREE